jgi:hypothetical protein
MPSALTSIRTKLAPRLDRFGVLLSGLCAVHCFAGLFLVSILGIGGGALANPEIHRVGLGLAVLIGATTLGLNALRHGRTGPLVIGGCGLALMTLGLFAPHGIAEAALTISGVALVATAHIRNIRAVHSHV